MTHPKQVVLYFSQVLVTVVLEVVELEVLFPPFVELVVEFVPLPPLV